MKTTKSSLLNISVLNRSLILAGLIALFGGASSNQVFAGWAWPWQAGQLQAQAEQAHYAQIDSESRAALAKRYQRNAELRARQIYQLSVVTGLLCAGVIVYLIKTRKVIQQVIKNETVEKIVKNEIVQKVEIVRSPAHDLVADTVVIDGSNMLYSPSNPKPSILGLLALLLELQKRNIKFKCFFDHSAYYLLSESKRNDHANAFRRFCFDFPDHFVEIPVDNCADDFILDYAHSHGTPIISNDLFRDKMEKYDWLQKEHNRRVSFLIHPDMIQIVPMGIQAPIPEKLAAAEMALRSALGKPTPFVYVPQRFKMRVAKSMSRNGHAVLAAA